MALPLRVIGWVNGVFSVIDPRAHNVTSFDIISYTWGALVDDYDPGIPGVTWRVPIRPSKLDDIRRFMQRAGIQYLWADCVCINQSDPAEKAVEIGRMYDYYRSAATCHILVDMADVWDPQGIVDDLKFVDHVLGNMRGASLAAEAVGLTQNLIDRLASWGTQRDWAFDLSAATVRSAGVDLGVLNCYATCIRRVRDLFDNAYFSRVWTFQEMILGKNITIWGLAPDRISCIGAMHTWMDLATDAKDKAIKLLDWIENCRFLNTATVNAVLLVIADDVTSLSALQTQVQGIMSARTDIINGGPLWWCENYRGIANVFSAVSLRPRECRFKADIFRGLLGVFNGLFEAREVGTQLSGEDDAIETISFNFFQRLSERTGLAWTKLAVSSKERTAGWDWIPSVENSPIVTTDCFAGVAILGRLKQKGRAKAEATAGIEGVPKKYTKIKLQKGDGAFQFRFRGCNCGKKIKAGMFKRELIPTHDQPRDVVRDETGRVLVQCATILGAILDPGCQDIAEYRRRLLGKLQPHWNTSDPSAKPIGWIDRSVSGTFWEHPDRNGFRAHNLSMNFTLRDITDCDSRLATGTTSDIMCEVTVNCGCTLLAPFSLVFEAITAIEGSSLGGTAASLDKDNRIVLQDGLGLVQVADVGRSFSLVAFGGDIRAHKYFSTTCRKKKTHEAVYTDRPWPTGRALVPDDFMHDAMDGMRDYGFVDTEGSGNLLICRKHPMDPYRIIGVCVDSYLPSKKGLGEVTIR